MFDIDEATVMSTNTTDTFDNDDNKGNGFYLGAFLVPRIDAERASIRQAWLPLVPKIPRGASFDANHEAVRFRIPQDQGDILPVVSSRAETRSSISAVKPHVQRALQLNGIADQLQLIPVLFSYRPKILDEFLKSSQTLMRDMKAANGLLPSDKRVQLNFTLATETRSVCEDILEVLAPVLNALKIGADATTKRPPAEQVLRLIQNYPFLVHHLFAAFPRLHVIHHFGYVGTTSSVPTKVMHIRYRPEDAKDINTHGLYFHAKVDVLP